MQILEMDVQSPLCQAIHLRRRIRRRIRRIFNGKGGLATYQLPMGGISKQPCIQNIASGGDSVLQDAQAKGSTVLADIGNDNTDLKVARKPGQTRAARSVAGQRSTMFRVKYSHETSSVLLRK